MTLLTEKEAAQKWCPLVRAVSGETRNTMHHGSSPANMLYTSEGGRTIGACIGSRCMAWRSAGKLIEMIGQSLVVRIPDDQEDRGYCGAFGKVEP